MSEKLDVFSVVLKERDRASRCRIECIEKLKPLSDEEQNMAGNFGMTPIEILHYWEAELSRWQAALDWLQELED